MNRRPCIISPADAIAQPSWARGTGGGLTACTLTLERMKAIGDPASLLRITALPLASLGFEPIPFYERRRFPIFSPSEQ